MKKFHMFGKGSHKSDSDKKVALLSFCRLYFCAGLVILRDYSQDNDIYIVEK